MAYFLSHADDSRLDVDQVVTVLSNAEEVTNLETDIFVPNVVAKCEFKSRTSSQVEVRLFKNLISIEGMEDAVLEFAVWFNSAYQLPLVIGNSEGPSELSLSSIGSLAELRGVVEREWGN